MPARRVLVTGGAGFLGSHIARHFSDCGWDVTVLDALTYAGVIRNIQDKNGDHYGSIRLTAADTRQHASVDTVFRYSGPFDLVVHAAGWRPSQYTPAADEEMLSTQVLGTMNVLSSCLHYGVPRVIDFGSADAYGEPQPGGAFSASVEGDPLRPMNIYSASKASQAAVVDAYRRRGLNIVSLWPASVYGPRQHAEKLIPRIIHSVISGRPFPLNGLGDQVREWVHVVDVVSAVAMAFDQNLQSGVYNIGSGQRQSVIRVYDRVTAMLALAGFRVDRMIFNRPLGYEIRRQVVSDTEFQEMTPWQPRVDLETGLRQTVAWYLAPEGRAHLAMTASRLHRDDPMPEETPDALAAT